MSKPSDTSSTPLVQLLPGSFTQIGIMAKYELLNYIRSRRFFVLLGIGVAIGGLITGIVGFYRPAGYFDSALIFFSNWWGLATSFLIVISGIFFGGDAISGEFQNKTGYFLVANPLRRSSIYVGKFLGAFTASLAVFGVYTIIGLANGVYYFGAGVPYQFGESVLFSILYLVAVLGLTFFFSSLFKTSSIPILVTAILLTFALSLIQDLLVNQVKIEPWFMLTYGAQIIGNILINPYPNHETRIASFTSYAVTVPEGLIILVAYFLVTAVLGLIMFEHKEFT